MLIAALSLQATDLRSPNLHPGCIRQGCNSCLRFDLLLAVKGVTMDKNILRQSECVHRLTETCNLVCSDPLEHPNRTPKLVTLTYFTGFLGHH